jgi:hypothetical protein
MVAPSVAWFSRPVLVSGVVVVAVALLLVAGEMLLLDRLRRPRETPPAPAQTSGQDLPAERGARPERPAEAERVIRPGPRLSPDQRPRGAEGGPPRPGVEAPLTAAVGALTAAHLYQTYMNLGLLADAVEKEVYTPATGRKLLEEVTTLTDAVEQQLARVPEEALTAEERRSLERVYRVLTLLRTQAKELRLYWDTEAEEHVVRFQKARAEAWAGIKLLLNFEESELPGQPP